MRAIIHQKDQPRGQSMMEFAVSITILLILLAGIADLGRALFAEMAMRDAAQEGIVYASVYTKPCERVVNRVNQAINGTVPVVIDVRYNGKSCSSAGVADACQGKEVKITVTDPNFPLAMPFMGAILGRQTIELKATVSGTVLRPACP